jgi:TRAP-type C4-dicarboxylate transport system permease small subunit
MRWFEVAFCLLGSILFTLGAFACLRFGEQTRAIQEKLALSEWQRQRFRSISPSTYRLMGWVYAVLAVVFLFMAVAALLGFAPAAPTSN